MDKEKLIAAMREAVNNSYETVPNTGIRIHSTEKLVKNCAEAALKELPQEIANKTLCDCQKEVAVKYGLGTALVTGHKAAYFNEATEMLLSAKDTTIKEQAEKIAELKQQVEISDKESDHWEGQCIMADAKLEATKEELKRVTGLLRIQVLKSEGWDERFSGDEEPKRIAWSNFKQQHGI